MSGEPQKHPSAALVCALMAAGDEVLCRARERLGEEIGLIRLESAVYPFDYTSYYTREMGAGLVKQLLCFAALVPPAILPEIKQRTMELERETGSVRAGQVRRRVNIDPGLLSIDSLVLASTKYSGHRICIAPALYAELSLLFQRGRYRPLEWTYPDYRSERVQGFLLEVRAWLLQERKKKRASSS